MKGILARGCRTIAMQTSLDERTAREYTIEFPTTKGNMGVSRRVTGFKVGDVDVDGTIAFGATIKVSGKPALTIETSGTGGGGE